MRLWLCHWPNGEVSIVRANNADEAASFLDEVGPASPDMLQELEPDKRFLLTFSPADPETLPQYERGPSVWRANELGEDMDDVLGDASKARELYEHGERTLRRDRLAELGRPCPTCGTTFPKTD